MPSKRTSREGGGGIAAPATPGPGAGARRQRVVCAQEFTGGGDDEDGEAEEEGRPPGLEIEVARLAEHGAPRGDLEAAKVLLRTAGKHKTPTATLVAVGAVR